MDVYPLSRRYQTRYGKPEIKEVAADIFTNRYFMHCMSCTFCHDLCCSAETVSVDVDRENVERILSHGAALELQTGIARSKWFTPEVISSEDFPSGAFQQAKVSSNDGRCVFYNRSNRGCGLHAYSLEMGVDYHQLKPLYCWLFPLEINDGLLQSTENPKVVDGSLLCLGEGPSFYRGVRDEVLYLFGEELVSELDILESRTITPISHLKSNPPKRSLQIL